MSPLLTFYGHFTGWSSYPTACKQLARHLVASGVDVGLVNLRKGPCEGLEHLPPGDPRSPIGLYHGFPDGLSQVTRHKRMVGYHVGDVDIVPQAWVDGMNQLDLVITQSAWCAHVFSKCGVRTPIHLSRAGIDPACVPGLERVANSPLRVVHFNSSEQWWRKGTAEVIVAMQRLAGELPIRVEVHTDHASVREAVRRIGAPGLVLAPAHAAMSPVSMAALMRSYDLLLAPSRAEGFGCLPSEFLCCGIPVVATTCTGHAETLDQQTPGLVTVRSGPLTACGSHGRAPSITADGVVDALRAAVGGHTFLQQAARAAASMRLEKWRWNAILQADRFVPLVLAG